MNMRNSNGDHRTTALRGLYYAVLFTGRYA